MVWTAPTPRTTGELITASIWNTDLVDNLNLLKTSIANDGKLDATDGLLKKPEIRNFTETHSSVTPISGALVIDLNVAEWLVQLNQNVTSINFTNMPNLATSPARLTTCTLALVGDGTVRTFAWVGPSGSGSPPFFRFSGNQPLAPTCTPADVVDVVTLRTYNGTHWFPAVYGQRM